MKTLLLIGIISGIAIYAYSCRQSKRLRWKYDCAYSTIQFLLKYGLVDRPGYKFIKSKFAEIAKMECCNREHCQVLEQEFYKIGTPYDLLYQLKSCG